MNKNNYNEKELAAYNQGRTDEMLRTGDELDFHIKAALTQERERIVGEIKVRYLKEEAFGANMSDDELMLNAHANGVNEALSIAIEIVNKTKMI